MELDNNKIQILDIIGIPTNNLLFSSYNDILIYSFGSTLILYNLEKNTKTFLQYYSKNEITAFKYLDSYEKILLSIDKSSNPLIYIWELPLFQEIYSKNIPINSNFNILNIFIEKLNSNLFIIIISAIDCNLLYILKIDNFSNFNIIKIGFIPDLQIEIEGFKCFYDDIYLIFISNNNLYYYLIDTQNIFNNKTEVIKLYNKIVFPFKLIGNSLALSNNNNIISFITSKGNCLIYNKRGNSIQSINPLDKGEIFTCNHLYGNSLCLGSNLSKIYIYHTVNFKMKYFIKDIFLNSIKINFELNNRKNIKQSSNYNKDNKNIEFIHLNENLDKIFIKMSDNSILFAPLTSLMDDSRGLFNFNSLGNTICLFSYNHSKAINSLEILNNYNEYETTIYTCSKDQTMIRYNIEYNTNKLSNFYFNLNEILNGNINKDNDNDKLVSNNNKDNFNNNDIYLTIIKFHPFDISKLFAGDNKGYLYIFDIKIDYFQYKKYTIDNYSIESLSFSREGNLLCIGFITGKLTIYDINKNMQYCLKLTENYLTQNEIDFRIQNHHMINFSYFFKSQKHRDCILFLKNQKNLEYSKLFYDENKNGMLSKKNIILNEFENIILDVKVHTSENYLIALNDKYQIIINELSMGETTGVIDLNNQVKEIYNFEIDRSGLYLAVICSLKDKKNNDKNNDLIFFEIGTGNIISYIKCIGSIYKITFDYYGKFIIMGGDKGELSLWRLPYEMSNVIVNVLSEIENNKDFWEQFEIKYYKNQRNNYENIIMDSPVRINRTEYDQKYPEEVIDNGPHKGIQTAGYNDVYNKGNKMNNPTNKILNNLYNNIQKENKIMDNINNKDNNENEKNQNNEFDYNKINDINKTVSIKNNNFVSNKLENNNYMNNNDENNDHNNYYYNTDSIEKNMKYNSFINIEKNNNNSNNNNISSNKLNNFKSYQYDNNYNNNFKNENSLQNCYEKFKKERLMKNSLLKPNSKNNKSKDKNNIFRSNSKNFKSQKLKSSKINSLSSPKIANTSKKYLKENKNINLNNKNNIFFSKEKFNKEEVDIDIDLDLDINNIRPNFDPNLYSMDQNQKYSQIIKRLIQPLISSNYERYFSRYNDMENGNKISNNILKNINYENNIMNKNKEYINNKNPSTSRTSQKSTKHNKKHEINNAMDILLDNKSKKNEINNIYDNNYINQNNIEFSKENILNKKSHKSISSKEISHDLAYINNNKIEPFNNSNYNNNYIPNYKSKDFENNLFGSSDFNSNFSNEKSNNFINNINNNNIFNKNKNKDTLSSEKRNYLEDKINNFENKLNYYGK